MLENILQGCRVIDLTQNVAGPFCTQILGDLGAEVIKIERPVSGDDARQWKPPEMAGVSTGFAALNRNKKSVCIDLDSAAGQQLVARLAASADVLVHSLKPGSAEARGLGDDHLRPTNPRLVYCAISAFGEVGPMRALPGYDPLMQAFTGIMSVSGHEGDEPARVGVSLIDMGTGMWATMAILAALLRRASTGEGMRVHASLLETGLSWMTVPVANYLATQRLPRKMGSAMAMMAPYELFDSADGKVFIAAANDRLFGRICSALACPGLAQDPRFIDMSARIGHREALHAELEARTRQFSTADCVAALRAAGAPCSEMHDVAQMLAHEQVQAVGMLGALPLPGAPQHQAMGLPFSSQGRRGRSGQPPPVLGASTDEVLTALGLDANELAALRQQRVVD
ncbi:CoA transferase [Caenimonas sedimenti]|uniref:CoA transferase n=1 Tax=Caenimonas sedimenti TaxID=2596921 RepID=A0A562ZRR9_9BURK|nr:CaiB/BaiF CoA-transferase family protein [Caenimonas sedimenti]TWO71299.1 CoA transferase [Caenimonas sedimenti]